MIQSKLLTLLLTGFASIVFSQTTTDSTLIFKKRVLETTELDLLTSYYTQQGNNAAVTGGIGNEQLSDIATSITLSVPLNDNDILSIDGTISAYTSASSSNLNPFQTGASYGDDDDDDDDGDENGNNQGSPTGSPWYAASGASRQDTWSNIVIGYSHSSENRNTIVSTSISFANEYDYTSFGGGIGLVKLFNEKNTEFSINGSMYLDQWRPQYPTEIKSYLDGNGSLFENFFNGVDILDQNGNIIDKNSSQAWKPINTSLVDNKGRNTFSLSLSFSQILGPKTQISIFSDVVLQQGWLANPMQRVYFSDKENFYIGNPNHITNYINPKNREVFQLADDIERLPSKRVKFPFGVRIHQYINEFLIFKTYYRFYSDNWGIQSNTLNIELPIKIGNQWTLYPNFRYYNQSAADYFAPYEQHLSTNPYYTSDFDLSEFNSNQLGMGIKYTDIFTQSHVWKFGLKSITLDYLHYKRSTGLIAHFTSIGVSFVLDK